MDRENLHIDLIEKYLDKRLNQEEKRLFDLELEENEDFVRDLNDMEFLIEGIRRLAETTTLDQKIARFERSPKLSEDGEKSRRIFPDFEHVKRYSWAIAASFTLVFVTTFSLFNLDQTPSHQKLYAAYYTPFENFGGTRSAVADAEQDLWKEALRDYDDEKYADALTKFNDMTRRDYKGLTEQSFYPHYKIYRGNTLMKLNKHSEAIAVFTNLIENDAGMVIQARWYRAMCYLYTNNQVKLKAELSTISKIEKSSYAAKANKLLEELD